VINPAAIITLGRFSMARYFPGARITQIHGQGRRKDGRLYYPMYHPAAALRNPAMQPEMEADFKRMMALLNTAQASDDEEPDDQPPVQLRLF